MNFYNVVYIIDLSGPFQMSNRKEETEREREGEIKSFIMDQDGMKGCLI